MSIIYSMPSIQVELEEEYERYAHKHENSLSRRISRLVKTIVSKSLIVIAVLIGSAYAIANFAPAEYARFKDIVFKTVDIEGITGSPDSFNKNLLDTWLIFNSEPTEQEKTPEK